MDKKSIFVTRPSMPPYEEYVKRIKPLWDKRILTNMGEHHQTLEKCLCSYLKANFVSLMTNGHMALEMAMQSMNLSGEVITTPFTFVSTVHAIKRTNLTPVFCDINENDFTIDVSKIESLINKHTCAIVPVHVFGRICNVEKLSEIAKKYDLKIIYDASHTFGATYKGEHIANFGDISTLSFHATKVFNTIEGGAVVYHDETVGRELYSLKNFGIRSENVIDGIGANAKMDEFRAIMGICNLQYIDSELKKRQMVHDKYIELLDGIEGLVLPYIQKYVKSNYAYFPVLFDSDILGCDRDLIYGKLMEKGIYTRKYFYPLISDADCYRNIYSSKETPIAKKISDSILTLPIYADLTIEDIVRICKELKSIIGM